MNKTAITTTSYNACADRYATKFMDFAPYRDRVLYFQREYMAAAEMVVDLGCGPGNVSKVLIEQNPDYQITGIDLSEAMVRLAKRNVPEGNFHTGDLRSLDLGRSFDIAMASFCIVHLADAEVEAFIKNLSHIVKPGGYLYLSFMEGRGQQFETTSFSEHEIFFNYFQREMIDGLLHSCGFEICEILEQNYDEQDGAVTRDIFIFAQR